MFCLANLHSKEDLAREESVSACRSLALQCSDAGALEVLLQHFFDVFHGSEGKLTVATHKMSVLQVSSQAFPYINSLTIVFDSDLCCSKTFDFLQCQNM
jgi:hypothetical protein